MSRNNKQKDPDSGWDWYGRMVVPIDVKRELDARRAKAARQEAERKALKDAQAASAAALKDPVREEPSAVAAGLSVQIYEPDEVSRVYNTLDQRYADRDHRIRIANLIASLWSRGAYRRLVPLPLNWERLLDDLRKQYPNFTKVVDYLVVMCTLAQHGDLVLRLPPLLLNGPPGIGKTVFAEELARGLGLGFVFLRMETAQTNAQLAGSSEFWSNTKVGEVAQWLLEKDTANPVFFLDELDKVSGDGKYDPLSTLYSLWEPATAAQFRDLSIPFLELNASRIIWLATTNDASRIPAPLLSRAKHFDIPPPTTRQARRIALRMFFKLRPTLPPALSRLRLSRKAVALLATLSPRQMQQELIEACGRAFVRGSRRIEPCDLDLGSRRHLGSRPIGFL